MQTADIVSLHIPLTAKTEKIIDAQRIQAMKTGSILINTARGGLVDEEALYRALRCGKLSAAGLDVFSEEPVRKNNRLLSLDNVSVTPHIAWLTNETLTRSIRVAVENSIAVMKDEKLSFQIC